MNVGKTKPTNKIVTRAPVLRLLGPIPIFSSPMTRHSFWVVSALLYVHVTGAVAQEGSGGSSWTFLPRSGDRFDLLAHPEEPRTGVRFEPGTSQLRLDVGVGPDLIGFRPADAHELRVGIDIFAYALTTNNYGLRLQIDALDGFFGGHIRYQFSSRPVNLSLRFRILHRSAHFVDGHIDPATGTWLDGRSPLPFTQDFGELVAGGDLLFGSLRLSLYSGLSYATLVRPEVIDRLGSLHGLGIRTVDSVWSVFGEPFGIYAAYNLSFTGIPVYVGTSTVEVGARFGSWETTGLRLFANYHAGLEVYGQYYDVHVNYWQIGFAFDIF